MSPSDRHGLERIYRRRVPPNNVITPDLGRLLAELTEDIDREIGVLIDRPGHITHVIVGEARGITIPKLDRMRTSPWRFLGLRCIHTRLGSDEVSQEDLTDLALLRLDLMAVLRVEREGDPGTIRIAHLLPPNSQNKNWEILPSRSLHQQFEFDQFIAALESEFASARLNGRPLGKRPRTMLVSVSSLPRSRMEDSLDEMAELADTAGLEVVGRWYQRRPAPDPRYLLGKGKLQELVIASLQASADMLLFDQELSPAQVRSIGDFTELRIQDRTQCILDIFAQQAKSRDGKLQVELAKLRYALPRLRMRDDMLSRLTGGIGARGPGETKMEISRRLIKDRISRLDRQIRELSRERQQRRSLRQRQQVPVVAIVGYTNAGKSTLLNTLTKSSVRVEDRLFATLDPASRRLRFPHEREIILTDTVGFIRDLPADLVNAFRATLEELSQARLLIHLVDASSQQFEDRMGAVERILGELGIADIPRLLVFNKIDRIGSRGQELAERFGALPITATDPATLPRLSSRIQTALWQGADRGPDAAQPRSSDSSSTAWSKSSAGREI